MVEQPWKETVPFVLSSAQPKSSTCIAGTRRIARGVGGGGHTVNTNTSSEEGEVLVENDHATGVCLYVIGAGAGCWPTEGQ